MPSNWTLETADWEDPPRERKPHGSGVGHVVSGSFYVLFGLVLLSQSARRALGGTLRFPEENSQILRRISIGVTLSGVLGIYIHGVAGNPTDDFFHYMGHLAVFFSFGAAGVVGTYESFGMAPIDSFRRAGSLSFFVTYLIFSDHAKFQPGAMGDAHVVLAQINLATTLVMGYSVYRPSNIEAGVAAHGLVFLQGIWVWTMSYLFFDFGDPDRLYVPLGEWPARDHVVPIFTCQFFLLVLALYTFAAVFCGEGLSRSKGDSAAYAAIQGPGNSNSVALSEE